MMKKYLIFLSALSFLFSCVKEDQNIATNILPKITVHKPEANIRVKRNNTFEVSTFSHSYNSAIQTTQYYIDGQLVNTWEDDNYAFYDQILDTGYHILSFVVTDDYGKSEPEEVPIFILPGDKPDVGVYIHNDLYFTDDFYENDTLDFRFNAYSEQYKILHNRFFIDDQLIFDSDEIVTRLRYPPLEVGSYILRYEATDEIGEVAVMEKELIIVPNIPPTVNISLNDSIFYRLERIGFYINKNDLNGQCVRTDLYVNDTLWKTFGLSIGSIEIEYPKEGDYFLRAITYDDDGDSAVAEKHIYVLPTVYHNYYVRDMYPTNDENIVIALDWLNDDIVSINLESLEKEVLEIPEYNPIKMDYDPLTNKAYILHPQSMNFPIRISIYNRNDGSFSTVELPLNAYVSNFEFDFTNDRAFLSSANKLYMINTNNWELISEINIDFAHFMVYSDLEEALFVTGESESSNGRVKVGKILVDEQEMSLEMTAHGFGYSVYDIDLHPSEEYLMVCSDEYQGIANQLILIQTSDLQQYGEVWDFGNHPTQICFTPNGNDLIAFNQNSNPYTQFLQKDIFSQLLVHSYPSDPYSYECTTMTTNLSGNKLVAFVEASGRRCFYVIDLEEK